MDILSLSTISLAVPFDNVSQKDAELVHYSVKVPPGRFVAEAIVRPIRKKSCGKMDIAIFTLRRSSFNYSQMRRSGTFLSLFKLPTRPVNIINETDVGTFKRLSTRR